MSFFLVVVAVPVFNKLQSYFRWQAILSINRRETCILFFEQDTVEKKISKLLHSQSCHNINTGQGNVLYIPETTVMPIFFIYYYLFLQQKLTEGKLHNHFRTQQH